MPEERLIMKEKVITDLILTNGEIGNRCYRCGSADIRKFRGHRRHHIKNPRWLQYYICGNCGEIMCANDTRTDRTTDRREGVQRHLTV